MKVLFITGWYPDRAFPLTGLWVRDQALAIAEHVTTSVLAPRSPLEWLRGWGKKEPLASLEHLKEFRPQLPLWGIKRWKYPAMVATCGAHARTVEKEFGIPDVIHAHMANPGGCAALLLRKRWGSRVVVTEHTGPFESILNRGATHRNHVFNALNAADAVVAVSPFQRERMHAAGIQREIRVIGNIVQDIPRQISKRPDNETVTLLSVGFPSRLKGTDKLIAAMGMLARSGMRHVRLRIAGGDEDPEWRRLIEEHGVQDIVKFLGLLSRDDGLKREYAACDAVIHASSYESFCIAAADALSAGKPVITTPCGGPEWFVDESNGVVAADFSAEALAAAVREVLARKEQYQPDRIAEGIQNRFSARTIGGQLIALYRELLQAPAATGAGMTLSSNHVA